MYDIRHALVTDDSGENNYEVLDPERDKITLNVGGIRHETLVSTLIRFPETRLGQLANLHKRLIIDEYFFDRNPEVFSSIIDYYRCGEFHIPLAVCGVVVKRELEYWNLKETLIQPCCWSNYCTNIDKQEALARLNEIPKMERKENEMMAKVTGFSRTRLTIWRLMCRPNTSIYARVYAVISMMFILVAVVGCILETVTKLQTKINIEEFRNKCSANATNDYITVVRLLPEPKRTLYIIDVVCNSFFTVELFVRLTVAPRPLTFIKSPITIIDILAIIPFYMMLVIHAALGQCARERKAFFVQLVYILRIIRVFRIFQMLAYFKPLRILIRALRDSAHELLILFIFVLIGMLVFATLIFYAERQHEDSKFVNIPIGFWWALITITTVGYGDIFPETIPGYVVGGACAFCGTLLMALTIPILSNNFSVYYTHSRTRYQADVKEKIRQTILLQQKESEKKSIIEDGSILISGESMKKKSQVLEGGRTSTFEPGSPLPEERTSTVEPGIPREPRVSLSLKTAGGEHRKTVTISEDYISDSEAQMIRLPPVQKESSVSRTSIRSDREALRKLADIFRHKSNTLF